MLQNVVDFVLRKIWNHNSYLQLQRYLWKIRKIISFTIHSISRLQHLRLIAHRLSIKVKYSMFSNHSSTSFRQHLFLVCLGGSNNLDHCLGVPFLYQNNDSSNSTAISGLGSVSVILSSVRFVATLSIY